MANSSKDISTNILSYSSSSSFTTPPTSIVQVGHGGGIGGFVENNSSKRKRGRRDGGGSSSTFGNGARGEIKRKKGELIDAPKTEPICSLCGRIFGSWKGVFGHLRTHPERQWRGAFPPLKTAPPPRAAWSPLRIGHPHNPFLQRQLLAPTLLDLAHQRFGKIRQDIDLNMAPKQHGPSTTTLITPPQGGGGSGSRGGGFDLNLPPPPE